MGAGKKRAAMRSTRRGVVLILAALFVVGAVGSASAFWSGSGSGSGSGATGTVQPVTLSPATASSQIYPGGSAGVSVLVTNPNPGLVRVAGLALDVSQGAGGFAVDGGHPGCGVGSLSYATQSNGGPGWSIPGGGSSTLSLPNALAMTTAADSACQGASFTVYLKATL